MGVYVDCRFVGGRGLGGVGGWEIVGRYREYRTGDKYMCIVNIIIILILIGRCEIK